MTHRRARSPTSVRLTGVHIVLITDPRLAEPADVAARLRDLATVTEHRLPEGEGSVEEQLVAALRDLEPSLLAEKPTAVLLAGNGPASAGAALAAAKLELPIARMGAGAELAREEHPGAPPSRAASYGRVVDRLASLLLCASVPQRDALAAAGLGERVVLVGAEPESAATAIGAWLARL